MYRIDPQQLTPELLHGRAVILLAFAAELDRHATEIAALAGEQYLDLPALGQGYYERLVTERDEPLQAAYHALYSVAYLGLDGGMTTATLLSAMAYPLRVLAQPEEWLCH